MSASGQDNTRCRLYLQCQGLQESALSAYFSQFGRVTDVYLPKGPDGSRKGYGFATFDGEQGVQLALAAGSEHYIQGQCVKINHARPRPAAQQKVAPGWEAGPSSALPFGTPVGLSPQYGWDTAGFEVPANPSAAGPSALQQGLYGPGFFADVARMAGGAGSAGGTLLDPLLAPQLAMQGLPGGLQLPAKKGAQTEDAEAPVRGRGPRIYVGGVPNAVSETMVRNYFLRWGQVEDVYFPKDKSTGKRRPFCFVTFDTLKAAERAVAESNREISGYQISSISLTVEWVQHYHQKGQSVEPEIADEWSAATEGGSLGRGAGPPPSMGRGGSTGSSGLGMLSGSVGGPLDLTQLGAGQFLPGMHYPPPQYGLGSLGMPLGSQQPQRQPADMPNQSMHLTDSQDIARTQLGLPSAQHQQQQLARAGQPGYGQPPGLGHQQQRLDALGYRLPFPHQPPPQGLGQLAEPGEYHGAFAQLPAGMLPMGDVPAEYPGQHNLRLGGGSAVASEGAEDDVDTGPAKYGPQRGSGGYGPRQSRYGPY